MKRATPRTFVKMANWISVIMVICLDYGRCVCLCVNENELSIFSQNA